MLVAPHFGASLSVDTWVNAGSFFVTKVVFSIEFITCVDELISTNHAFCNLP